MNTIQIQESDMIFTFLEEDLFQIELCPTVATLGNGVKIVEMIVRQDEKLIFIEAKKSSPRPGNSVDFDKFINDICEKFRNSLILFTGIVLNRPFKTSSTLPASFTLSTIATSSICFYLIIKGHEEQYLPPLNDQLKSSLSVIGRCFKIDNIKVINDVMAKKYKLIS